MRSVIVLLVYCTTFAKKKPTRVTWLSYASKNPRRKYVFQKSKIYARINFYWTYTRHVVVFCYNLFTCLINFFSCKWCTSFRGQICKFLTVYKSLEIFKTLQNLIRLGYFLSLQLRKEKTIFIVFFFIIKKIWCAYHTTFLNTCTSKLNFTVTQLGETSGIIINIYV